MTDEHEFPDHPPRDPLNEAIWTLVRTGHKVFPASPVFGGLWHVDRGPLLTDVQLIALARQIAGEPEPGLGDRSEDPA